MTLDIVNLEPLKAERKAGLLMHGLHGRMQPDATRAKANPAGDGAALVAIHVEGAERGSGDKTNQIWQAHLNPELVRRLSADLLFVIGGKDKTVESDDE